MSYFLSKLKEQATSFQSIAKNMMVYENTDREHDGDLDEEDEEEVLDQPENTNDNSTDLGMKGISKKQTVKNSSTTPNNPSGSTADEFFNQFIPSLQQKTQTQNNASSKSNQDKNNNQHNGGNNIIAANNQKNTTNSEPRKKETTNILQDSKTQDNHHSQQQTTTATAATTARKNSVKSSFQVEEFEERVRAYQIILQENEQTIDHFKHRVVSLEQQIQNMQNYISNQQQQQLQQQQNQFSYQQEQDQWQEQLQTLLQALDEERQKSQQKDQQISYLHQENENLQNFSHELKIEYQDKVQEIESILNSLVQNMSSENLQNQQQQQQQQQQQNNNNNNNNSNGGSRSKKGKRNNNNSAQQQQQNPQVVDNTQNFDLLNDSFQQIKDLLKPKLDSQPNMELTIQTLEQNNLVLKEINLQLSDRMLALERLYDSKIQSKIQELEEEYQTKTKVNQEGTNQKIEEINKILVAKQEELEQLALDFEKKNQENHLLNKDFVKQTEEYQQKTKEYEQKLKEQQKQFEEQMKLSGEQNHKEQVEVKKYLIEQVFTKLQSSLVQSFEISEKLPTNDNIDIFVNQFVQLIKDNFKGTQQLDQSNLQIMKDTWEQICERFKQHNLIKHQKQAQKDSQQWLTQRFITTASQQQQKKKQDFKDSELYKFFDNQLQTIFQLSLFIQDQINLQNELNLKKETLTNQLTKLQKECREMSAKEKETIKLKEQLEILNQEKDGIKQQMQEVLQDKIGFKIKVEEQREKMEMLVVENANLKDKVTDQEDEGKRLRKQIKQLQGQHDLQEDYKLQLEKSQQELKWTETQLRSKENEMDEFKKTITNLQRALQHQQEEYEQNLRLKEREQAEDKQLLQTLQLQNNDMKEIIRESAELETRLNKTQYELDSLKETLEKSEIERKEVKKYAQELVEKVKKDSEQQEFMIDRRMINKFLINYANPNSSREVKMQMLDAMSKILAFTIDEKQTLGLVKKSNLTEGGADQSIKGGIGEKLINFFLMDEDDD